MAEDVIDPKTAAPSALKKMLPVLLAIAGAVGGAGGAAFLMRGGDAKPEHGEPAAAAGEPAAAEGEQGAAEGGGAAVGAQTVPLEPFLVNLVAEEYARYLKVKIELQVSADAKTQLDAKMAQVRDVVIGLLSSRRFEDVTSLEGKVLLKEDISERVTAVLGKGRVESVMFTEFVVQ